MTGRLGVLVLAAAAPLVAQEPACAVSPTGERACNAMVDAVRVYQPLAALALTGGNPLLGTAGGQGRLGRVGLVFRVTALGVSLPDPDSVSQATVASSFDGLIPAPALDAAVGLYESRGGFSITGLASVALLPTGLVEGLDARGFPVGLGYGARVGLLKRAFPVPDISVSLTARHLPRVRFGDVTAGDVGDFAGDLDVTSFRAVMGWHFVLVSVAAGVGVDRSASSATIRYQDPGPPLASVIRTVNLRLRSSREVLFVNGGLALGRTTVVLELGYQTGRDQNLSTVFADFDPSAGHAFGGLGLRFAL